MQQIHDMFEGAGIKLGPLSAASSSGERRSLTQRYMNTINWDSEVDCRKVLKAVTITLFTSKTSPRHKQSLRALCEKEGLRIEADRVVFGVGSSETVKNLIFAAIGYKPEIVLIDATTNEIKITKHADKCLVYDRPIRGSLLWSDLVTWWMESSNSTTDEFAKAEPELRKRLEQSLGESEPEKLLMSQYFKTLRTRLGEKLPALIPQVYLHYDPYTIKQREGLGPLPRQRMDFLLLLQRERRVVLEIDGKQHYSEGDQSSPRLYAEMVAEDRRLKLRGYEVFRFGGHEFMTQNNPAAMLSGFFIELFKTQGYEFN